MWIWGLNTYPVCKGVCLLANSHVDVFDQRQGIERMELLSFYLHIALPDVIQKDITADHEFIVLACDGE